jgi:hypothetical protein
MASDGLTRSKALKRLYGQEVRHTNGPGKGPAGRAGSYLENISITDTSQVWRQ